MGPREILSLVAAFGGWLVASKGLRPRPRTRGRGRRERSGPRPWEAWPWGAAATDGVPDGVRAV